jgi:hypothetical protein
VAVDRCGKERRGGLQISLPGQEHVDDLPVLVDGPVDVSPGPGDLDVGLVNEPVTAHAVAAWPGRLHQQRREPLDPSEQGDMVDLDAALSEELLQITVRQSVAQVPAHGDQDDLWREPESGERRHGRLDGSDETEMLHSDSLVHRCLGHEPLGSRRGRAQCNSAVHSPTPRGPQ